MSSHRALRIVHLVGARPNFMKAGERIADAIVQWAAVEAPSLTEKLA